MSGVLRGPRRLALAGIAVLVAAASLASFAESYRGLYEWAVRHGLRGVWASVWPLQIDVFIAVGELALFVALADRWPGRARIAAWLVTGLGLAVSVAGNVGHVAGHAVTSRVTAAVPPLAAAAALSVGLGVLKRVVDRQAAMSARKTAARTAPRKRPARRPQPRTSGADTEAAILSALSADPDATTGKIAAATGLSDRTVRRVRARLAEAST